MTSKEVGFDGVRQIGFEILVSCITFSNLITIPESQFYHLRNGDNYIYFIFCSKSLLSAL